MRGDKYPYVPYPKELVRPKRKPAVPKEPKPERFANAALRDAAVRAVAQGDAWAEIAQRMDGTRDGVKVQRLLGLKQHTKSKGSRGNKRPPLQTTVSEHHAVLLCRALDVYPRDVGL